MSKSLVKFLDRYPPYVVRIAAHKGRGRGVVPMSNREISEASGISMPTVNKLSRAQTWGCFRVDMATAFMEACGFNPFSTKQFTHFMTHSKLANYGKNRYIRALIRQGAYADQKDTNTTPPTASD